MTKTVVVIGAGGFGREVLDVIEAMNTRCLELDMLGVVDDQPSEANLRRLDYRGVSYLGTVDEWLRAGCPSSYVVGIGSPSLRRRIVMQFESHGHTAATLVHPSARVGSAVRWGAGSVLCAGATLSTNVRLGRHVHLNPNVIVGHDSNLHDFVSVNPGAIVSGGCSIGEGSLIGSNATVLQGLDVGARSTVGAAACVVRDVGNGRIVKGVPAQ